MALQDYKKKIRKAEKNIKEAEDISKANKEKILEFAKDLKVNDYSKSRIFKLENKLKIIAKQIDFDFEEAEEEDIKNFVAWVNELDFSKATKVDYKVIIKRFYKWLNGGEYPETVEWIKTTIGNNNETLPKDVLNEKDIQNLSEAANNARDKALISILWETGARIGELIDLKVGDFEDFEHGKKIIIDGKTGSRRLPLISSVPRIQAWVNTHPDSENKDAPLWVNVGTRNTGQPMQYRAILKTLKEIAKRAEVDKPVNPHHFRHSRATYLASRFTEAQMCEYFGWVQGSDVPARYVHMSGRDIDGDYARLHGIEDEEETEESELAPIDCPRCGAKNDPEASFCQNCGQALTQEAFEEIEKKEEKAGPVLSELGISEGEAEKVIKAAEKILKTKSREG